MKSMTGFGSMEAAVAPIGKICVELRSTNHKFLETVFHLPEGLLSLEDKIKRGVASKIKRGRVVCVVTIVGTHLSSGFINQPLLGNYVRMLKKIKKQLRINDEISINTLMHLPGVLSVRESKMSYLRIWPKLRILLNAALVELVKARQKEGKAIGGYLRKRVEIQNQSLEAIKARFKKVIKEKLKLINLDEERASFLKDADITEEIERLGFHIKNFKNKLAKSGPIGKELDFIAQEMQREANTLGAKSIDTKISARAILIKSQIEKIREQVQNIE
ncbi:MAG: YicC family protein [Candidatus Omnitrophica bacterium]|nr:YicC family protein [Candidatus Omnitrophota bacterium]